jgi:soluble lytic murein transglycosylase
MRRRGAIGFIGLLISACAFFSFFVPPVFSAVGCPNASDCLNRAIAQYRGKELRPARAGLIRLLRDYPDTPESKRAAFLLGRVSAELEHADAPILLYQALVELPELSEYTLLSLGDFYLRRGRFKNADLIYDALIRLHSDSPILPQARFQKAEALMRLEEWAAADEAWTGFIKDYPNDPLIPDALFGKARVLERLQNLDGAAAALYEIRHQYPISRTASETDRFLERLKAAMGGLPDPSPEQRYRRARLLFDAARYPDALSDLRGLKASAPSFFGTEQEIQLGMTLFQLRRYEEARGVLEPFLKKELPPDLLNKALFWLGRTYFRLGLEAPLLRVKQEYSDRRFVTSERGKLLTFLGVLYEDSGRNDKAVEIYREAMAALSDTAEAEEAGWRIGWLAYREGRYAEALEEWSNQIREAVKKPPSVQLVYWQGRAAERLGRTDPAAESFRRVCTLTPHSYYCHAARMRFKEMGREIIESKNGPLQPNGPASPESLLAEPHLRKAEELSRIGLPTEASGELSVLLPRYASDHPALLVLARRFEEVGGYTTTLQILRNHFPEVLERGNGDLWRLVYPLRMADHVKGLLSPGGPDPYLVAAVIREESTYDPQAQSRAGALGLMQLMPATGQRMARRLGVELTDPSQLLDPDLNIRLGASYLGSLLDRFNGDLLYAVAGYNAGPDTVEQWIRKNAGLERDEFIEAIPFPETRLYTKKVLRSYAEYLALVDRRFQVPPETASY